MSLPVMPSTHTWVQGGPVLEKAGRNTLYASDSEVVWVWDEDTGLQVTDLRDATGATISVVPIVNGWVAGVGVPNAVVLPSFSVGQNGPHYPALPVQTIRNAASALGPADTTIAGKVSTPGSATDTALKGRYAIAATVTAAGALGTGKHTPVDATSGALTVTLPASPTAGEHLSVEKVDATANAVTVSGSLRGATSIIALVLQHETLELLADGSGSWWPVAGHKTKGSLDAAYSTVFKPEAYGADPTGVADSTTALINCLAAANATARAGVSAGIIHPGATVEFKGTYNLSSLAAPLEIRCNIRGHSATLVVPAAYAGVAVRVGDERASGNYLQSAQIDLPDIVKPTGSSLVAGSVGCRIVNIGNSELSFGRILYFETGQHYTGYGEGAVYLKVFPGYMAYVKTAFKLVPDATGGWCNQIEFIGGSVQQSSSYAGGTRVTGWEHVHIDGNGINNVDEIHFLGTSFEGDVSENAIYASRARNITFTGCRHEQGTTGTAVTFAASANVTWTAHGLSVGDMVAFTATANPGGLYTSSPYYVISVVDANTITIGQKKGGTAVTFTSAGTTVLGYRPHRVKIDTSNTLYNFQIEHPWTLLGLLEIVDASGSGSGIGVQYAERRILDTYGTDDIPLFKARNRYASAPSRPAFAAYPPGTNPREDPRGWAAALGDRGVIFASAGAGETSRLFESAGVLQFQRAGQSAAQIGSMVRAGGLTSTAGLSCAANAATTFDVTLTGAAVNDYAAASALVDPLPAGIIFSHARVSSANTVRFMFYNVTASAISLTVNLQPITISRFN